MAGSLLCSLAPSLTLLVVFRMVQALGGSMLNPVAMSIITNTFTDPKERAQAIGVWGGVVGVSMALGPVVGGLLVSSIGWRSIFWINIPVGLVAVVLAVRYIPESRAPTARRVDVPGQVLVIVLLASLTYGIIEAPNHGWTLGAHRRCVPRGRRIARRPAPLGAPGARAPDRPAVLPVRAVLGGHADRRRRLRRAWAGSSSSTPSTSRRSGGSRRSRPGSDTLPMAAMAMVFPPISGRIVVSAAAAVPCWWPGSP